MQVLDGAVTVYQNKLHLKFEHSEAIQYIHRLDLLPGSYSVVFSFDGRSYPYSLTIPEQPAMGDILRVNDVPQSRKPLAPAENGPIALVSLPAPGTVTWTFRKGLQVLQKSSSQGSEFASFNLPTHLEPATYELQATYAGESRTTEIVIGQTATEPTILSYNANLQPALRWSFLGHQWLLRNNLTQARQCLETSLSLAVTKSAEVELARAEALSGDWDAARDRARKVLASDPNDFDSLTVLAYIETKLQDYAVAAQLYRRAIAVQDSPALRTALAKLPPANVTN